MADTRRRCALEVCGLVSSVHGLVLHPFPAEEAPERQAWIDFVRGCPSGQRSGWTPPSSEQSFVCSLHFDSKWFQCKPEDGSEVHATGELALKPGAVPTRYGDSGETSRPSGNIGTRDGVSVPTPAETLQVCAGSTAGDNSGLKHAVSDVPSDTVTGPGVLPRICPCGQVVNVNEESQAPGWKVRREVSIQCGLQSMPPLPLAMEIFPSATTTGDNTDKGRSWNQARRVSQELCVHEKGSEQLFQCHLCPYTSPRLGKLQSHLVSHSTEKPFKCEVCPAAYKSLKCYRAHMCKHTGEKLYQCHLCPYWTVYWKCLLEHRGTHSNAKPFACTECPFRAKSKANLRRHKLKHEGDSPFKCKVCSLGFHRKGNLKNHMQQHKES
ncbi:zinc finger protein 233 isoform X3 [Dermacentor silvarum]|uniref:zinc finger protein 233 isoform X2 n=1 Tax=Dermacentor silvarum TaxID=543639 RepID=UPI002100D951|nr:zinc finger protein 233 isoform X2 [Dermacentor silvarum]XP_049513358.1 zinc finger protein 233 isoform X3 [Dermacentor silvarum]